MTLSISNKTKTNTLYHINWKSNRIWNTFQWITPIWPNTVEWSFTHSTLWFNSEQTEKTMRLSCGWWVDYRFRIGEIYLPLHLSNKCLCSRRYKVWTMNQAYFCEKTFCVGSRMVNLETVLKWEKVKYIFKKVKNNNNSLISSVVFSR